MQREAGEGRREGEMLTFSREQQCIEAAAAVASLPPSPLCISPSLPFSLFFSCSLCRMTGIKSWLLIKTPTRHQCLLSSPHALSTLSLSYVLPLSLVISFPCFLSCSSYFATLLPCCSSSLHVSLHSPRISHKLPFFHFFNYFSLHPFLPLSLPSPLYSSPRLPSPQLPRLSSRNRV